MQTIMSPLKLFHFLICIGLLHTTACSTRIQITEYRTDRESKLPDFMDYCWADESSRQGALEKIEPTGGHHRVFDQTIRDTINADLNNKGYQNADCSSADFIIDYRMGLHEDIAAEDADFNDAPTNPYGPRWSIGDDQSVTYEGLVEPREEIITVRHGTMHVAAFSNTNRILWHTSAEKTLNEQDSDEVRKANIKMVVQKIMASFPAKQK